MRRVVVVPQLFDLHRFSGRWRFMEAAASDSDEGLIVGGRFPYDAARELCQFNNDINS